MKKPLVAACTVLAMWACGQDSGDAQGADETLTRAEKDSIVATLPIPGASGVGRALDARDAANARTEAHDSIG
jgi:hypothetical protein